jgi:hypothetical protein
MWLIVAFLVGAAAPSACADSTPPPAAEDKTDAVESCSWKRKSHTEIDGVDVDGYATPEGSLVRIPFHSDLDLPFLPGLEEAVRSTGGENRFEAAGEDSQGNPKFRIYLNDVLRIRAIVDVLADGTYRLGRYDTCYE